MLVAMHALQLLAFLFQTFPDPIPSGLAQLAGSLHLTVSLLWPLLLALVLSIRLARLYEVDPLISAILAVLLLLQQGQVLVASTGGSYRLAGWGSMSAVVMPILSIWLMQAVKSWLPQFENPDLNSISPALSRTVSHLLPFTLSFAVLASVMHAMPSPETAPLGWLHEQLPDWMFLGLSAIVVNLCWWLGLDGGIAWDILTADALWRHMLLPGFRMGDLLYSFVYIGGCGGGMALTLALWRFCQRPEDRALLRWTTPFTVFNIGEPLIYGFPIVGRRALLLPFVLIPTLGTAIAYLVIVHWQWIEMRPGISFWLLPVGTLPWVQTQTPWRALALILAQVGLAFFLYARPIQRAMAELKSSGLSDELARALDVAPSPEVNAEQRFVQHVRLLRQQGDRAQQALRRVAIGELRLHYQPKMELQTGRLIGLEALLRLVDREGHAILPGEFLAPLETAGFGDMFDLWVVRQVLSDLQKWPHLPAHCRVSVNLSTSTLRDDDSIARIVDMVRGIAGTGLEFEVLESSLHQDPDRIRANLDRLRALGCSVAIDDFGTGYSNLAVMHALRPDTVKLDRSLLTLMSDARGQQLYREVCIAVRNMGSSLVSEGVEHADELAFVKDCGVFAVQGWFVGAAVPAEAVPSLPLVLQPPARQP